MIWVGTGVTGSDVLPGLDGHFWRLPTCPAAVRCFESLNAGRAPISVSSTLVISHHEPA